MKKLLKKAGLKVLEVLDADSREAVTGKSERIYIIARKSGENQTVQNAE